VATEVKQRNNRVFVLVGAAIALLAFGGVIYFSRNSSTSGGATGSGQQYTVVVAKQDLPQGSQLGPDNLTTEQVGIDQVPAGATSTVTDLTNKFLSIQVSKNTVITPGMIVADAKSATTAALSVQPLPVHDGYVAIAIPTDGGGGGDKGTPNVVNVGNFVQPDDHIDMIIDSGQGSVRYAFQDVRVLKVGDASQQGAATTSPSVLIVELPRAQAEEMAYLLAKKVGLPPGPNGAPNSGAHILSFVLRDKNDSSQPDTDPKKPYTPKYLDDKDPGLPQVKDQPVDNTYFSSLFPGR